MSKALIAAGVKSIERRSRAAAPGRPLTNTQKNTRANDATSWGFNDMYNSRKMDLETDEKEFLELQDRLTHPRIRLMAQRILQYPRSFRSVRRPGVEHMMARMNELENRMGDNVAWMKRNGPPRP